MRTGKNPEEKAFFVYCRSVLRFWPVAAKIQASGGQGSSGARGAVGIRWKDTGTHWGILGEKPR